MIINKVWIIIIKYECLIKGKSNKRYEIAIESIRIALFIASIELVEPLLWHKISMTTVFKNLNPNFTCFQREVTLK